VEVGNAVLSLQDPRALQLDLLRGQPVEQTPTLAQEHWNDMELQLVEGPGEECEPATPAPCASTFLPAAASFACVIALVTSPT
jgi:hypothetical protein